MQTTLNFSGPSTIQEWSNFKGILNQAKKADKPLIKSTDNSEGLINHLTKQLQGSGVIKIA